MKNMQTDPRSIKPQKGAITLAFARGNLFIFYPIYLGMPPVCYRIQCNCVHCLNLKTPSTTTTTNPRPNIKNKPTSALLYLPFMQ